MTLKQLFIGLLLTISLVSLACTTPFIQSEEEPPDVPTRLYYRIGDTWDSYNHMRTVWEQIIDAEEPVSCGEVLSAPDLFTLTETEAVEYPDTVGVRDHVNNAIGYLTTISATWESECADQRAYIPIAELRDMENLLDLAEAELIEADYEWSLHWQL